METLESLSQKLATTNDIQSIVQTMKSLSSVSIHQYETAVESLKDYQLTIDRGLQIVLQHALRAGERWPGTTANVPTGVPTDAAVETRAESSSGSALIVIGSDRGLCGRFNEAVTTHVRRHCFDDPGGKPPPLLCAVGVRGAARFEAWGVAPDSVLNLPGSVEGLTQTAQSVLVQIERWQTVQGIGTILLAHNERTEQSRATPRLQTLVPPDQHYLARLARAPWPSRTLPMFTQPPAELFSWLVRQYLYIGVYRALAESLASEHASRLAAMQAADRNIDERRSALEADYRKKRQESITNELLDIIAGFEATSSSPD